MTEHMSSKAMENRRNPDSIAVVFELTDEILSERVERRI